ncbi:hypothetical protein [Kangiella sp. TOML190]|uniref:hypothetical protein n=1 Tax=Kangiella sp. TOML190 TaxID=2931351 RepID=UPI0020401B78|nr:hypothetical protein [Kangiella sp. TOML190]
MPVNRHFKLTFLLLSLSLVSCVTVKHQLHEQELAAKIAQLQGAITSLDPLVKAAEAKQVATISVYYPLQLAKEYELTSSPIIHNMLVNQGIKNRGLCIHWTEDLLRKLSSLDLSSLKFYWGVANREATFRLEHSAVVVSPSQKSFADGLVLDAWRDSGLLYFAPVKHDKYQWHSHYNDITAELLLKQ